MKKILFVISISLVFALSTDFFDETILIKKEKIVSKYYIEGDVHFNSIGNEKIFQNFERILRK